MTTRFSQRQVLFLISAALVAATFVAYEPIRHNGFVSYDDRAYITENPNVTAGITQQSLIRAFTQPHVFMWHPLTTISHILDYQIFGLNPLGHHFVNLLLHIINAIMLFWILSDLTGSVWPSAFVAAIFALHPLQVESVAWAAERKTVMSGLFWFLTMVVYVWYTKRLGIGRYILLFAVYALCIMTKPVVVTLPLVLLLLDYWPLERLNFGCSTAVKTVPTRRLLAEKIPLLALSAILCAATFITQRQGGVVLGLDKVPLDVRTANAFISYVSYIGKMIWPSRLAVIYPYTRVSFSDSKVVICMLLLVLMTAIAIYTGRRRKYAAVGWLWFVGTLVPMIGLVQAGNQSMADRYMYLSMLGLLFIAAWAIRDFVTGRPRLKIAAAILAAAVLLSAITADRTQVKYWQNSMQLFGHALKVTKNNQIAENNFGTALFEMDKFSEAEQYFNHAIRINPGYLDPRINLGKTLLTQKKYNEAVICYNKILQRNNKSADVFYRLGVALNGQKKYDEAIKHFAKALEIDHDYPDARNKMELTLMVSGRTDEAIAYFNEILRTSKAKAVELKPENVPVLNDLAWLLATTDNVSAQDANSAIRFAQHVCELTGYNKPEFLDTLAAAYAAAGRFEDAVNTAKQGVTAAKAGNQEDLANEIQSHMKLYQAGHPYRGK